ncbi:MAG: NADP-specific glutamate dehydrogenase [Oscillospiraceae bacterium]|nr:NADP-specific glutamate dehydrogenase [Oscillospiraceae bacterium]
MSYTSEVLERAIARSPGEPEFHQALREVIETLGGIFERRPEFVRWKILDRLVEPDRFVSFRVPWVDGAGEVQVNRGYRVQYNSAIGPYKGGIRFHPSVTGSVIKFLGFEQTFKNGLTGLPIGGGKGGADFDPKGKSDTEVLAFCQSFVNELYRHIGPDTDVPAGDIGVGAREVGYMTGQYKRLTGNMPGGVFTGKGPSYGGSLGRPQATGYGLVYLMEELLRRKGLSFEGKRVAVSGAGNVAIYSAEKVAQLGGKPVTVSDSGGYIYDADGVDIELLKRIKFERNERLTAYRDAKPSAEYKAGGMVWEIPCDVALPCATQNELPKAGAELLVKNGCKAVGEGANMPSTPEAVEVFAENGVIFAPGKAANAGGVSVSALEMTQNSMRRPWTFEEVDRSLLEIMKGIVRQITEAAETFGQPDNLVLGANAAGFLRVAEAMMGQGVV